VGLKLPIETIFYSIARACRQCDAKVNISREVTYCLAVGAGEEAAALLAEPGIWSYT
jgi:hypothetical protein